MAKTPAPAPLVLGPPPSKGKAPSVTGATGYGPKLSFAELRALWIAAGGSESLATTMAGIAMAESGGYVGALNDNAKTGDYSVGLWQINYLGSMRAPRTDRYGTPEQLRADPLANARAAVDLAGSRGERISSAWRHSYESGAYKTFIHPVTPAEKAQAAAAVASAKAASPAYQSATVDAATAAANAQLTDPNYIATTTDLSLAKSTAVAQAKAVAHISDPWVTVTTNKAGKVVGFGESTGETAPKNVLLIGGQAATKSLLQGTWNANYDSVWQAFTGRTATAADIADVLHQGLSVYALKKKLTGFDPKSGKYVGSKTFSASPAFQQDGVKIAAYVKSQLGKTAPQSFVASAILNNWDQAAIDANLRKLPSFPKGPAFTAAQATISSVYNQIYGTPDPHGQTWIHQAALNGWTQDQAAQMLRKDPAYKFSPEYESKATNFLDAMGLFTGQRPVLTKQTPPLNARGAGLTAQLNLAPAKAPAGKVVATAPQLPQLPVPA